MRFHYFFIAMLMFPVTVSAQSHDYRSCMDIGMKNNLGLQQASLDRKKTAESLKSFLSQYSTLLNASYGKTDSESTGTNPLLGTKTVKDSYSFGLNRRFLLTGGILSMEMKNEKTDTDSWLYPVSPIYDTSVSVSYVQPLLKNFLGRGEKNLYRQMIGADSIAEASLKMQKAMLENMIARAFYSLAYARENLNSQKDSLDRAKKLLDINKKKMNDGLLEEVDIIATEAAVTIREASLLIAEASVRDAEDNLRHTLGMHDDAQCSFDVRLSTSFKHVPLDADKAVRLALGSRPEILLAERNLEIARYKLKKGNYEKLPDLGLTASYGLGNTGISWDDNSTALQDADNPSWYLGLDLSFYPFNKPAAAVSRDAGFDLEKAKLALEDSRIEVANECRSAVREVNTRGKYVLAAKKALRLQEKKLYLEEKKFNQGRSAIQWILTYQDDVSSARTDYYKALTDYEIARSDYEKAIGGTER
jgi:outer membrane protein TolC